MLLLALGGFDPFQSDWDVSCYCFSLKKDLQVLERSFSSNVVLFFFQRPLISETLFELSQSSSGQDGSGEVSCAEVLSLFSLKERNVGKQELVQLPQEGYVR